MLRTLGVFLGAAGTLLLAAVLKALLVSGMATLPPVKLLVFATSTFGLVAALIDWAVLRDVFPRAKGKPIERARLRPIVFREKCPAGPGLSFYGGAPVGPSRLAWPRVRHKPGGAPLSFILQWDLGELAREDVTGLLPAHGVLYLFADLSWGEPFDFQFVHERGPVAGWGALPVPPGLPPVYGGDGAYAVPYCSPRVAKELQDVPRLLPKWCFAPVAFSYPAAESLFWEDGERTAEALLLLEGADGGRGAAGPTRFGRPFAGFPHDYAAVRVVAAKVLARRLEEGGEGWKAEAARRYSLAVSHAPGDRVAPLESDELWRWMEGLEPVLGPGWGSVVEECVNVSVGLGSEGLAVIPEELLAQCARSHRLAMVSFSGGAEVRSVHAPCPNHMFGPPSYVQGDVEEYVSGWLLLLELSSRRVIGHEFGEGVLQFLIQPEDLRAGRFERVKLVASAY